MSITIQISNRKSVRAMQELLEGTDAKTPSEVFSAALRLHLALLRSHRQGVDLYIKKKDGTLERALFFSE